MSVARIPKGLRIIEVLVVVASVAIIAVLNWEQRPIERGGHRPMCKNNLKQLGLALHTYREAYGQFPPPCITDREGRPMHSWRVLLLPYLDYPTLIKQYDFSEPWNGPNNSKLANQMPKVFGCPDQKRKQSNGSGELTTSTTDYLAVVGPGAPFKPGASRQLSEFKDRGASTIMVVEVADSQVNWMEPKDIDVSKPPLFITGTTHKESTGMWSKMSGIHVLNVDGSVRFLPSNTPPEALLRMITID